METMNTNNQAAQGVEIWAGIECTVNRVGDHYIDQLFLNGHDTRIEDLDRFAALGIRAIRYPLLWERLAPDNLENIDWRWTDERMERLRALGIRPIAGLLHHGSGPRYTSLMDPEFPEKLAAYARSVAQRYPWVDAYTPVNEILTTARFSGLYGHWYPHGQSPEIFLRTLLNQVRGVQLAMQAIREINPLAQLIQTDDLGKIFSAPSLAYQADHENERRWLAFDLLCGRVDRHHPMHQYLAYSGVSEHELDEIASQAVAPDVLGINYYITSERYLDDRIDLYPEVMRGGNGRQSYIDVEAVRVCLDAPVGPASLLQEAWDRYQLPMALTEVHLGGHHEHQLRWLMESWDAALALRNNGVDMRAITIWSLLGAHSWNKLVTSDDGIYESGVFDASLPSAPPRPTILARATRALATEGSFHHPVLDAPGWWKSPIRLVFPPVNCIDPLRLAPQVPVIARKTPPRPVLITGARGTLGQAFQRICDLRGIPYVALQRQDLDITSTEQIQQVLGDMKPWALINTAGYVRVDEAEQEPEVCMVGNTLGPTNLAVACHNLGIPFLSFSSDLVFDGQNDQPYVESMEPNPLNVYGLSKAEAEAQIFQNHPGALVVRTSAFFGPWDPYNFASQVLQTLSSGDTLTAADDTYISPTYVPDLVHACLDLLVDGETGIWHLANHAEVTWAEFAQETARQAGIQDAKIIGLPMENLGLLAPRPNYSVLGSERARLLPDLGDALFRFLQERETVDQ